MVAEPWILRMGNQVSGNLNSSMRKRESSKKLEGSNNSNISNQTIGILSFEVANVMSKIVHLHTSLSDQEISKLKNEIIKTEGVKKLISSDESYLLELAFSEKLDDLNRVAEIVSRLGKKCTVPALQGFEHVYGDVVSGVIDVRELGFLVKDMESMIRKIERYVGATSNLYSEMEVLNELEQATKKFQVIQNEESRRAFEQKLVWQKQDVRHLKDVSLWNQTFDKIVELMARTVCTIYARICVAFGNGNVFLRRNSGHSVGRNSSCLSMKENCVPSNAKIDTLHGISSKLASVERVEKRGSVLKPELALQRDELDAFRQDFAVPCGPSPARIFLECLSLSSSVSRFSDDEEADCRSGSLNLSQIGLRPNVGLGQVSDSTITKRFGVKSRLSTYATPSTIGGSALALHYANVIIVIEKLLRYPHLVGEEARDDLYQMLPTSLRKSLRVNLRSYFKNLAIYDAPLAHDWKANLDAILKWLAPLAHNMIRWQSERSVEQQQIVKRTNVLLLQTLYFADREKTEVAICELLVGLNYICRYEHQQNALLDCAGSFDFGDWMEWQLQCQASYPN